MSLICVIHNLTAISSVMQWKNIYEPVRRPAVDRLSFRIGDSNYPAAVCHTVLNLNDCGSVEPETTTPYICNVHRLFWPIIYPLQIIIPIEYKFQADNLSLLYSKRSVREKVISNHFIFHYIETRFRFYISPKRKKLVQCVS